MRPLTKYGTYGFLTALVVAQIAMSPALFADDVQDKIDRAGVDAKKSGRSIKRDVKKGARKATGQDNAYDDVKDSAKDAGRNAKDELELQKRKIERKTK